MNNMKLLYLIILFVLITGLISGCSVKSDATTTADTSPDSSLYESDKLNDSANEINIDKLEIYHFHGDRQCTSCIAVGNLAEETINTYFKDELDNGIIVFKHINIDHIENKLLAMKYGATGSSLWFGTYKGNDFKAEENLNVWYKINDKQAYMDYLKGVIEAKLVGD